MALHRLPKVHLYVLDAVVLHLKTLVICFSIFYVSLTTSLGLLIALKWGKLMKFM